MNGFLDDLFGWVGAIVETFALDETDWLAFLVFSLTVWLALAFAAKVLTVLGAYVVPFVCRMGIVTGYLLALNADYLLTRIIRPLGGKPFGVVYALGDATIRALPRMMDATRASGRWWLRESRIFANRKLLLLITVIVVGWWNGTYCERVPAPDCRPPSTAVTQPLSGFTRAVATYLGGAF